MNLDELGDWVQTIGTTLEDLGTATLAVKDAPHLPLKRTIDLLGARGIKASVEIDGGYYYFQVKP